MKKTHDQALALLQEYTKTDSLLKHAYAVEAAMLWYAKHFGETDLDTWAITGLLHDFDYEMFPDPESGGHPYKGDQILAQLEYPQEIRTAIMGHALFTGVPRETKLAKTLFAVDELTGLVVASVLVRPDKSLHTLEASSVIKKMKDKHFARGCNREEIKQGAADLGIEFSQHITNVITAMREIADLLGLAGAK
jgi:predicted hydrolase (HD superfamily)